MTSPTTEKASPRERLLAAANELFYEEGVHTVGIDRVIARAGVAKASLYSAFGSKDELVRAYLEGRQALRQERITRALARCDTPRARILCVFDVLGEVVADPAFHGCAFINASVESRPESAVRQASDVSRAWMRSLFVDLARDAGAADPERLAQQLTLLYDGASVAAQLDGDEGVAAGAHAAAATLLDVAINR
jgi:AcrR family transcriptional regulator